VSLQYGEHAEPQAVVTERELRRLRALERLASPETLADADDAARIEEHDELEARGRTSAMSDPQARRILGITRSSGSESYLATEEVRRRLGLPQRRADELWSKSPYRSHSGSTWMSQPTWPTGRLHVGQYRVLYEIGEDEIRVRRIDRLR